MWVTYRCLLSESRYEQRGGRQHTSSSALAGTRMQSAFLRFVYVVIEMFCGPTCLAEAEMVCFLAVSNMVERKKSARLSAVTARLNGVSLRGALPCSATHQEHACASRTLLINKK